MCMKERMGKRKIRNEPTKCIMAHKKFEVILAQKAQQAMLSQLHQLHHYAELNLDHWWLMRDVHHKTKSLP